MIEPLPIPAQTAKRLRAQALATFLRHAVRESSSRALLIVRRTFPLAAAALCCLMATGANSAADEGSPARAAGPSDFNVYKLITDRNIFDSERSARALRATDQRAAPKVERFSLVGTLIYEKGPYAFFDGSSREFRQALEPGKAIGNYKVVAIDRGSVQLESGTNSVRLSVGMEMRREDDGPWEARGEAASSALVETHGLTASAAAGTGGVEENDLIKRMMQQREQELK